jgi:carbon-monoxide dehydrogenase medium subunit
VLLDAELVAAGPSGERTIPASSFFGGFLTTDLAEDELLTEVRLPVLDPNERWGFREFAQRRGDFALAGAAVTLLANGRGAIERARVAVFGTADRPVRSVEAEGVLTGDRPTDAVIGEAARRAAEAAAADDPRPDAGYRRHLTETIVRRALEDAAAGPGTSVDATNGHREAL